MRTFKHLKLAVALSSAALAVLAVAPATTVGVVRPETGNWHWFLRNSNSEGTPSLDFLFGSS